MSVKDHVRFPEDFGLNLNLNLSNHFPLLDGFDDFRHFFKFQAPYPHKFSCIDFHA